MEPARVARYIDKINPARDRLEKVVAWAPEAARAEMPRLASYKAFQEAAEAMGDLAGMVRIDSGEAPKDDYANLAALGRRGVIPLALVHPLEESTGLRNRLVHEYERLDDPLAVTSMLRLVPDIDAFLQEVEGWLRRQTT